MKISEHSSSILAAQIYPHPHPHPHTSLLRNPAFHHVNKSYHPYAQMH